LDEGGESGVDLAFSSRIQDVELKAPYAHRFLHVSDGELVGRAVRVHQQGNDPGLGNQLREQFEPLGRYVTDEKAEAGQVAARPGKTGDEANCDRVTEVENADELARAFAAMAEMHPNAAFEFPSRFSSAREGSGGTCRAKSASMQESSLNSVDLLLTALAPPN
jgi:hypothetical protein